MDENEYLVIRSFNKVNRVDLVLPIFYNINSLYISSFVVENYIKKYIIFFSINHKENELVSNLYESWI